jgi:excisionase family DNA binding protein
MPRGRKGAWPPGPEREVFTTGEVAKLCNVTIRTVIRWFDAGVLEGYKIPNSKDRRIPREKLVRFMRAHGIPLGLLENDSARKRILIVDDEEAIVELLRRYFEGLGLFDVQTARDGYEAGTKTVAFRPHLLLIDYNLGSSTGADVARTVRADPELKEMRILCMSGFLSEAEGSALKEQGIDDFMKKPFDLGDVQRRVYTLLGMV